MGARFIEETQSYRQALAIEVGYLATVPGVLDALRGKTVAVTGATGQIGSAIVRLLAELNAVHSLGVTIVAAGRSTEKLEIHYSDDIKRSCRFARFVAGELFDPDIACDYIVHCAGYGDPAAFIENPVGVLLSNIQGLRDVLERIRTQGHGRVLFVSSGEVYGQGAPDIEVFNEDYCGSLDVMRPRSCYPMAKRAGETLLASYVAQHGIDALVVRQCHVFGPGYSARDSHVTAEFFNHARAGEAIVLKSAGTQVRSYMFEVDVAGSFFVLLALGKAGEAYNNAPDYTTSIKELGQTVAEVAGVPFVQEKQVDALLQVGYGNITRSVLDAGKLNALGWTCPTSFFDAIAATVGVLRELETVS